MARKNYSGSDLSPDFKAFFRKEKKRIIDALTRLGCTNIELSYGFYYFSGFFTTNTGQIYYLSSLDVRDGYSRILYRTAQSYTDYTGGHNQYIDKDKLMTLTLS